MNFSYIFPFVLILASRFFRLCGFSSREDKYNNKSVKNKFALNNSNERQWVWKIFFIFILIFFQTHRLIRLIHHGWWRNTIAITDYRWRAVAGCCFQIINVISFYYSTWVCNSRECSKFSSCFKKSPTNRDV